MPPIAKNPIYGIILKAFTVNQKTVVQRFAQGNNLLPKYRTTGFVYAEIIHTIQSLRVFCVTKLKA